MSDKKIETLEQLKKESSEHGLECYILLSDFVMSSKIVSFNGKGWWVLSCVDDSEVEYEDDEHFRDGSSIPKAIENGALFAH